MGSKIKRRFFGLQVSVQNFAPSLRVPATRENETRPLKERNVQLPAEPTENAFVKYFRRVSQAHVNARRSFFPRDQQAELMETDENSAADVDVVVEEPTPQQEPDPIGATASRPPSATPSDVGLLPVPTDSHGFMTPIREDEDDDEELKYWKERYVHRLS